MVPETFDEFILLQFARLIFIVILSLFNVRPFSNSSTCKGKQIINDDSIFFSI